jgi:hypothetical protein
MPVLQSFEGLSSIEAMSTYSITSDSESTEVHDFIEIKEPSENKSYPIIGILDSGIAKNKCLSPWFLKIEGLYRDHLEKTQENIITDFCLVITIKDTKKNTKVYDKITAGLEANNFIQNNIKIKTDIQLKN